MLATLVERHGKILGINSHSNISQEGVYKLLEVNAIAHKIRRGIRRLENRYLVPLHARKKQ